MKQLIESSKSSDKILRIEQRIPNVDLIKWLQQQTNPVKIYWSERDEKFEVAGIGYADFIISHKEVDFYTTFKRMRRALNPEFKNLRYYGGFCFSNAKQDTLWQDFGTCRFIIPQVELLHENNEIRIALNFKSSQTEDFPFNFFDNNKLHTNLDIFENKVQTRTDYPEKNGWIQKINFTKKLFQEEKIEKIVLARKAELKFSQKLIPEHLLMQLKKASPKSFHFYFQPAEDVAFLGASPELLYRRENFNIFSEAVAGTLPRGNTEEEDINLERNLLNSNKDIYEHDLVCQVIEKGMKQICNSWEMDRKVNILKSNNVQHLYKKFWGLLKEQIDDPDIISVLHPTPAVGGSPKEMAFQEIGKIETFDRGWYSAPVGWVGPNSAEFAVGIRSGLMKGNELHLFAGAGIVPDSDPEQEWNEIEQKISPFMKLFQG